MIYIVNILFEILLGIILLNYRALYGIDLQSSNNRQKSKQYIAICGFFWILISALRGWTVGADTISYYLSFESVKHYSFSDLISEIYKKYILRMDIRDPGYNTLVKVVQIFIKDYQLYLLFIACVFMIPFCKWINRESKNPVISFTLYSCLFYAFFSITGVRQTIATTLVVLIGDRYIKERKLFPFIIITIVASSIHASALVFLPFYFLSNIKINKKNGLIWIGLIVLSVVARGALKEFFIRLSGYEEYTKDYERAGTLIFSTVLTLLFLWSFLAQYNDKQLEDNKRYYNALSLAMFFLPLTWLNPSAMRVVQYFSIYLVLLIPEMVNSTFSKQDKGIVTGIILGIFVLLLIRSNPTYVFFWQ